MPKCPFNVAQQKLLCQQAEDAMPEAFIGGIPKTVTEYGYDVAPGVRDSIFKMLYICRCPNVRSEIIEEGQRRLGVDVKNTSSGNSS